MFEQSIIVNKSANRPLSFLASVSGELLVVGLLIVIPLAYNEHLPGVHWKDLTIGPPVRQIEQRPIPEQLARSASHAPSTHRVFVYSQAPPSRNAQIATQVDYTSDPLPIIDGIVGPNGPASASFMNLPDHIVRTPPPLNPPAPPVANPGPIRVSQGVQMAKLIKQVLPVYPPLARAARVYGVVHLIGIIARDGTIRNLELVSGHPLLTRAAIEAVQQWIYKPTLLSGEPMEVICPIDVNFTLGQ